MLQKKLDVLDISIDWDESMSSTPTKSVFGTHSNVLDISFDSSIGSPELIPPVQDTNSTFLLSKGD